MLIGLLVAWGVCIIGALVGEWLRLTTLRPLSPALDRLARVFFLLALAPVLPLVLAALFGSLAARASSRLRHSNDGQIH